MNNDLIDWNEVRKTREKWLNNEWKSHYWEYILKLSKQTLNLFKIDENSLLLETSAHAIETLRDYVLGDLNKGLKSNYLIDIVNVVNSNLMFDNAIAEMYQELSYYLESMNSKTYNKISNTIHTRYLLHSLYSKIDTMKYSFQSFKSYYLNIDNMSQKAAEKVTNVHTKKSSFSFYDVNEDKFIIEEDKLYSKYKHILSDIAYTRNNETHKRTDFAQRMERSITEGSYKNYYSNIKESSIWLVFAYIVCYASYLNKEYLTIANQDKERFFKTWEFSIEKFTK